MEFNAHIPGCWYHTANLHIAKILSAIELALCHVLYIKNSRR
ncbi:hypothetical protein THOG05_10115 [Vibrio rotiferianus]|nr:hypothetical protein THOG05_10115 [Vibrio rotiferianus]CAH1593939.1 hypothetical protein THOG10_70087 [Vibrio rotiferianus]CAH1594710.1 hypothetical protein THOB06_70087 [Vibrio rotiferianus]